ncbi:uncharacterized protein [Clytia hemisphaerica]
MMHAMGVYHTHQRPDRDEFVDIQWQNLDDSAKDFNIEPNVDANYQQISKFDYGSLMHFKRNDQSINGKDTIVTKNPDAQSVIGQRDHLSEEDIKELNELLCPATNPTPATTTTTPTTSTTATTTTTPSITTLTPTTTMTSPSTTTTTTPATTTTTPKTTTTTPKTTTTTTKTTSTVSTTTTAVSATTTTTPTTTTTTLSASKTTPISTTTETTTAAIFSTEPNTNKGKELLSIDFNKPLDFKKQIWFGGNKDKKWILRGNCLDGPHCNSRRNILHTEKLKSFYSKMCHLDSTMEESCERKCNLCNRNTISNYCKNLEDGNYNHPTECDKYVACSGHITHVMPCPTGLNYNKALNQCLEPEKATCSKKTGKCVNAAGGFFCRFGLRWNLLHCNSENKIKKIIAEKCPFSCQTCLNPDNYVESTSQPNNVIHLSVPYYETAITKTQQKIQLCLQFKYNTKQSLFKLRFFGKQGEQKRNWQRQEHQGKPYHVLPGMSGDGFKTYETTVEIQRNKHEENGRFRMFFSNRRRDKNTASIRIDDIKVFQGQC